MNINYIAGFFDGEGSIVINNNKISISIPQTNENILLFIKNYFKAGEVHILKKRKEHWKDAWCYRCTGSKNCLNILKELEPFLIIKKNKAREAIIVLENYTSKEENRIQRNKNAINLVLENNMSYRQVEKITGISRQTLCNEMKKIRLISEMV